jgi:hypothetical protein
MPLVLFVGGDRATPDCFLTMKSTIEFVSAAFFEIAANTFIGVRKLVLAINLMNWIHGIPTDAQHGQGCVWHLRAL